MPLVWLGIALAFGVGEVLTLAFYALFVVIGAVAAAVAASLGLNLQVQVLVFAVVSILGVVAARPPMMHYLRRRSAPEVRSGAEEMIGREAPVVEAIVGEHHPGHVRIGGENWPAISATGASIPAGSTVRVTGLKQATLVVEMVRGAEPQVPPAEAPVTREG
ncbi:MAG: NfeD family protein [Candidatus Dormibacteraeota bacterium]|nr:NfeD family protein [Candidatus Dormibacteraeota bacterium]